MAPNIDWTTFPISTNTAKKAWSMKFGNGIMVFSRQFSIKGTADTDFGGLKGYIVPNAIDLYTDENNRFIEAPTVTATFHGNGNNGGSFWLSSWSNNAINAWAIPQNHFIVLRPNTQILNGDIHIIAIGRWK